MSDHQEQLADLLSEFARTMITDFSIETILDRLVTRIVDLLPITAAGVTMITPPLTPHYVVASNDLAKRFEELQIELGEGPCLSAYHSGHRVIEGDLDTSVRFPLFAGRAVSAGFGAVFAFPLQNGQTPLGALGLYRDSPGVLSPQALRSAQTLADVAAAYLINAEARLELQRSSDQANHRSLHDELTGLPNRTLLLERLGQAFLRSRRTGAVSALLFVDVDGFKEVNDRYGHAAGDELLVGLTARLRSVVRPNDTLSRLHGDEFVILCEDLQQTDQAQIIADRIDQALLAPFAVPTAMISITASVGIAFADRDSHAPEQILRNADAAMYQAKRTGGGRRQIFGGGDSTS